MRVLEKERELLDLGDDQVWFVREFISLLMGVRVYGLVGRCSSMVCERV